MDINSLIFSDEYLFILDKNLRISQANLNACLKLEWSIEELICLTLLDLLPSEQHERVRQKILDLTPRNSFCEFETTVKLRRSGTRVFRWRAHRKDDSIYLLGRDFSAEKQNTEDLKNALDRLQFSLSVMEMGLWERDFSSGYVHWSERLYAIYGVKPEQYPDSESLQKLILQNSSEAERKITSDIIRAAVEIAGDINVQYKVYWPNGEQRYVRAFGKKAKDAGTGNLYFGIAWDATEEVATEKIMQEQQAKLIASTKMAALGEMSGGIAHEINNPLTVIQARSFQLQQMVEMAKIDPEKVKQAADSISRTADKIARIIKSLRSFARDGANDPFDLVPITQIIEETLEFCRARFYNHGVEVAFDVIDKDLEIECRVIEIEQVLLNLLNNSFDAIEKLEEKWIRISTEETEQHLLIHVTDSGKGIPPETIAKMMQPFFSTKEVGKGTGLGLSISNGIVHNHKGELFVDKDHPNTRITIRLPKLQQASA